jgi:hypothetical protein
MTCMPFGNEDTSYNCATYTLSPECFHKFIRPREEKMLTTASRGIELGEEYDSANDSFMQCV